MMLEPSDIHLATATYVHSPGTQLDPMCLSMLTPIRPAILESITIPARYGVYTLNIIDDFDFVYKHSIRT